MIWHQVLLTPSADAFSLFQEDIFLTNWTFDEKDKRRTKIHDH